FSLVQMLPINEIGRDNSPYNAISSRAIEPTTLYLAPGSPAELTEHDFSEVTANENLATLNQGAVKYLRVGKLKRALLQCAFDKFQKTHIETRRAAFARFCTEESEWLEPYAFF